MGSPGRSERRALHERSDSRTNASAAIRMVSPTPPRAVSGDIQQSSDIYSRSALPTSSVHIFPPTSSAGYKEVDDQGFALTTTEDNVSPLPVPATPQTMLDSALTALQHTKSPAQSRQNSAASSAKPRLKKRKHVAVDSQTKTFKILDAAHQEDSPPLQDRPSLRSLTSKASHDVLSLDGDSIGQLAAPSVSYLPTLEPNTSSAVSSALDESAPTSLPTDSSWTLRFVPKTPDLEKTDEPLDSSPPSIPRAPNFTKPVHDLLTKSSFQTTYTVSTTKSDNTNYQVYGDSSPSSHYPIIPPPSSNGSNHRVIDSSPPQSLADPDSTVIHHTVADHSPPASSVDIDDTVIHHTPLSSSPAPSFNAGNATNYEVYGSPSVASSIFDHSEINPTYSRESLVVAPLAPRARLPADRSRLSADRSRLSSERLSGEASRYYRSTSRNSVRNGSIHSISTVFSQKEATSAAVQSASIIHLPALPKLSAWSGNRALAFNRSLMQETPHQWSSQLSTVPSESEGGSNRGSQNWSEARTSNGVISPVSRHLQSSMGSSGPGTQRDFTRFASQASLDVPQPSVHEVHGNNSGSLVHLVNDDEHEDIITDMPDVLRPRLSRSRLSGMFGSISSQDGRTSTIRSTASSRLNSLTANSLPTWAKLYYGSGERKYLSAPGNSTEDESRPHSAWTYRSDLPSVSSPPGIYSPRKRPRGTQDANVQRGSMDINAAPALESPVDHHWIRRLRVQTSSIWSPHLQTDRRAVRRSVWDPPVTSWSQESRIMGKRNRQVVMFIVGFIFPFAWIVAGLLPLPPNPKAVEVQSDEELSARDLERNLRPVEENHYQNAKWWRDLNRWMSVIGFIILAIIIILVVLATQYKW